MIISCPRLILRPALSFPLLATTSLRRTLLEPSLLFRVYALYASDFHFHSLSIISFRYVSSGRERGRSSDRQPVQGEFIGITTSLRH